MNSPNVPQTSIQHHRDTALSTRRVLHVLNYAWPHIDGYTVRSIGLLTAQRQVLGYDTPIAVSAYTPLAKAQDASLVTEAWGPTQQIKAASFDAAGEPISPRAWERADVGLSSVTANRFYKELSSIVERLQPDIIHAHHPHYVGSVAMRVAQEKSLPGVYELRCINGDYDLDTAHPYYRARGYRRNALEYALARQASVVVTISDGLADRLVRRGVPRERVHVIRNSVNTQRFTTDSRRAYSGQPAERGAIDPQTLRVGYATTFEQMENLDGAVRAAQIASRAIAEKGGQDKPKLELVLAGDGRDWTRIRDLVSSLGLDDVVKLPGFIAYSEMPRFYHSLDLFLVPRKPAAVAQDTTPLKPLEALACGLPMLCTDLPALRELLSQREDVHFTQAAPQSMAQGMIDFANAPWPGSGGIEDRSWSREVHKYEAVYEQATNVGPPQPNLRQRSLARFRTSRKRVVERCRGARSSVSNSTLRIETCSNHLISIRW